MESLERAQRSLNKAQELCAGLINDLAGENVDLMAELGRAVAAERERCAKIAEKGSLILDDGIERQPIGEYERGYCHAAEVIADAIRSGK